MASVALSPLVGLTCRVVWAWLSSPCQCASSAAAAPSPEPSTPTGRRRTGHLCTAGCSLTAWSSTGEPSPSFQVHFTSSVWRLPSSYLNLCLALLPTPGWVLDFLVAPRSWTLSASGVLTEIRWKEQQIQIRCGFPRETDFGSLFPACTDGALEPERREEKTPNPLVQIGQTQDNHQPSTSTRVERESPPLCRAIYLCLCFLNPFFFL